MFHTIILPIMRVLGTVTLSVTIMLGGPIALSISQERELQASESSGISDGCAASEEETPPCTMID